MGHSNGANMAMYISCQTSYIAGRSTLSSPFLLLSSSFRMPHTTGALTENKTIGRLTLFCPACRPGMVAISGFGLPPGCAAPAGTKRGIFIHGTEDPVAPYNSSAASFKSWTSTEHCTARSRETGRVKLGSPSPEGSSVRGLRDKSVAGAPPALTGVMCR